MSGNAKLKLLISGHESAIEAIARMEVDEMPVVTTQWARRKSPGDSQAKAPRGM